MGAYVYALRSPKNTKKIILNHGKSVEAGSLSYLYKPFYAPVYDKYLTKCQNTIDRTMARLEKLWEGQDTPKYVVVTDNKDGHKIRKGQQVLRWNDRNAPNFVYDDPDWGGAEVVGEVAAIV